MEENAKRQELVMNDDRWQKQLRWILGTLPVGVVVVDQDLDVQAFNSVAAELTGCDAEEALGRPYAEVLRTQQRDISDPLLEAIETGQTFVNQRFYLQDPEVNGESLPIRHSASVVTDPEGQVIGGVTIFADISRQVALERALEQQRRYLRDVLRSIPDGVATLNTELRIESWNDAAAQITGLAASAVLGQPCREVLGPSVTKAVTALLQEPEQRLPVEHKTRLELPNGERLPIGFNVGEIRSPEEELQGAVVIFRDIRERLARRHELYQQRHYLNEVLQFAPYGIFTLNQDLEIRTFNRAAEKLTGFAASYAVGKLYTAIFDVDDDLDAPLAQMMRGQQEALDVRLRMNDAGGKRVPIQCSAAPLTDADNQVTGAIVAFRDISDIVAAERTKNEFISMVSHELRTPLTSIKGFVTALLDGRAGELNDKQRRFLSISREQSNLLLALINDLLDLTRAESGRMEMNINRISVADILQDVANAVRPMIESKTLEFQLEIDEALPPLWADAKRITQVLQNLLSNAVKFTPTGGKIRLDAVQMEEEIVFSVTDSGIGISLEEQEQIFEPFYQVENIEIRRTSGTGLGLAIVKRIVTAHGGHVELESQPGVGSTFRVHLPTTRARRTQVLERPAQTGPEPQAQGLPPREGDGASEPTSVPLPERERPLILVVDDDVATNTFIRFLLEEEGYEILSTTDGTEALSLAATHRPDVITLDLLMPEVNGYQVLRKLKENPLTAEIPVCITSIIEEKAQGYRLGAIDYITKPFDSEHLLEAIHRILAPASHGDKTRILVAEDDLGIMELVEMALPAEQFEVFTATDGITALEILRRDRPDLVLLDIMIPRLDGYDFIRQAKADPHTHDIPILVLSVRSLEEDINYALRLGAERYLVKAPGEATSDLWEVVERTVHEILDEDTRALPPNETEDQE